MHSITISGERAKTLKLEEEGVDVRIWRGEWRGKCRDYIIISKIR